MSSFALGDNVLMPAVCGYDKVFRIVGTCNGASGIEYYCVGWDCSFSFGFTQRFDDLSYWVPGPRYSYIEGASNYKFFSWIDVGIMDSNGILFIHNPNQTCMSCKRPAPHAKPNVGNDFVCSWCSGLQKLNLVI